MKLIEFDGVDIKVADEAFLIRPIRELFRADRSKGKEDFWRKMSYLWFMCDPRSTYMYITDPDKRAEEIRKTEGFGDGWTPDALLVEAMEAYRKQTITTASVLLEGMRKGIDKLVVFFNEFDLFALDKNDRPIYQVSTMTGALKQIPELAKALAEAEKALAKDFAEADKARGGLEKSPAEDW